MGWPGAVTGHNKRMVEGRAELYLALAEALSEPPAWLARPGKEWPLFAQALTLAPHSAAAAEAEGSMAAVGAESPSARRARYRRLFMEQSPPRCWLYESLHRSGRLIGPESHAVRRLYEVAGLAIGGAELPDHASLELAFLAHLARQAGVDPTRARQWRRIEKWFLKKHAGRWLPELGQQLAATGDPVYAPIGLLLVASIEEALRRPVNRKRRACQPQVRAEKCTLCGFCVQACPSRALAIVEDRHETALLLAADLCSGCGRCVQICETDAMQLRAVTETKAADTRQILRRSPRVICRGCGRATVSRAELAFVAAQLGGPRWLEYCLPCRARLLEKNHEFSSRIPAV